MVGREGDLHYIAVEVTDLCSRVATGSSIKTWIGVRVALGAVFGSADQQ